MRRMVKQVLFCLVLAVTVWSCALLTDMQSLRRELVRLHVMAEDQGMKLRLKDAVLESLMTEMEYVTDAEEARVYLRENLPKLESLAKGILRKAGCEDVVTASLGTETFATWVYDTFMLPAGVYEALRLTIVEEQGENWWLWENLLYK